MENEERNPTYTFIESDRHGWVINTENGEFSASFTGFDFKAVINPSTIEKLEDIHEIADSISKGVLELFLEAWTSANEDDIENGE